MIKQCILFQVIGESRYIFGTYRRACVHNAGWGGRVGGGGGGGSGGEGGMELHVLVSVVARDCTAQCLI